MNIPHQNQELPTLWAIAGSTRRVGRTLVTAALGGLLALKNRKVELIRPDFFFNAAAQRTAAQPLCAEEMDPIFRRLNADFASGLYLIFEKLAAQYSQQLDIEHPQLFLDLNASLSHHSIDLFLAADIKLVVIDPSERAQKELDIFLNACFMRWLELTLQEYDDSFHEFLASTKSRRDMSQIDHLDFFDSQKLRQAIADIHIQIIVNKVNPEWSFQPLWKHKRQHGLYAGTQLAGQLLFDRQSASLILAITIFFNHLFHHRRLDLFKCIEEKIRQVRYRGEQHPARAQPLNTWPYSVVDGQVVLNLDPADFDASTTESDFSGLDSHLFE